MIPETEWFRPPTVREMCRRGDARRFLLAGEPIAGGGVYGVGWEVTEALLSLNPEMGAIIEREALDELRRRVSAKQSSPEASLWEQFEWRPVFYRSGQP